MNKYWTTAEYIDEVLRPSCKDYIIIKSYRSSDFSDGNIDVVIDGGLFDIYENFFSSEFILKRRDIIKSKYYERNKLMCTPMSKDYISIHLHTNVGWHDLEFFSYKDVLVNSEKVQVGNSNISLCNVEFESKVLLYHALFEKFGFSDLDLSFIDEVVMDDFQSSYDSMIKLRSRSLIYNNLKKGQLWVIWFDYYRRKKGVKIKNLLFHLMLLIRQRF